MKSKTFALFFSDLRFNPLKTWTGDVKTKLPNLLNLCVAGTFWIPQENVLTIPSLEFVYGVSWSNACSNCYLHNSAKANGPPDYTPEEKGKEQAIQFAKLGFLPFSCGDGSIRIQFKCQPSYAKDGNLEREGASTIVPQKLFYGSYVLGAVAIILNFIILVTVFSARSLRNSTSMLLISNMALCDLLVGIYSVIIGDLNIFNFISNAYATGAKLSFERQELCGFSTVIFSSAQCVAAATSLLLTIEKYLSIIYCMDPNRRLSKKVAFSSVILLWVLSLLYSISPIFGVFGLSLSVPLMCSFPIASGANTFLIFPSVLIALYLINIPLYVAIFISVRKSGANLGIKRETVILKKIALVVVTNFLLLLTPFILIITLVPTKNIHKSLELDGSKNTQMLLIFGFWFPIACLGFNSCINPILCAFRQGQFLRQIRKALGCFSVPGHIQAAFVSRSNERPQPTSQLDTSSQVVLHSMISFYK